MNKQRFLDWYYGLRMDIYIFVGIVWRESPAGGRMGFKQAWDVAFKRPPAGAWMREGKK